MEVLKLIGKRLKVIRVNSNIKQKELAKEFNIQPALLSMYEAGSREPSILFLNDFAKRFNITLSELFINVEYREPKDKNLSSLFYDLKDTILDLEKKMLKAQ